MMHKKYIHDLCLSLTLNYDCMLKYSLMVELNVAFHIANFMAFGDYKVQRARATCTILLTYFTLIFLASAPIG